MSKLHQILAVEKDLTQAAARAQVAALHAFSERQALSGQTIVNVPLTEDVEGEDTSRLPGPSHIPVHLTVEKNLRGVRSAAGPLIDAQFTKEAGNTGATSDIRVGTEIVAKDVPVTALLMLEHRLNDLRKAYAAVPTLDPSRVWEAGDGGIYRATEERRVTTKVQEPVTLAKATPEHAEQAQLITVDRVIGTKFTTFLSGAVTEDQRAEWLSRIDQLLVAVKEARSRANDREVEAIRIAGALFGFIHEG